MKRNRRHIHGYTDMIFFLAFVLTTASLTIFHGVPLSYAETSAPDLTGTVSPTPTSSETPVPTAPPVTQEPPAVPSQTPQITSTPSSKPSTSPSATPASGKKPKKTPTPLKTVTGIKVVRYSTHSAQLKWKKIKKAKYYRIYYGKKKSGKFHLAKTTKNTRYRFKKLKNKTTYYFYVVAGKAKKKADTDSLPSKKVHIKMKTMHRKTIFAGDSITEGIAYGDTFRRMKFEGKKKVVAAVGLNTITFHTKRAFHGRTGLQKLISEKPSRVFMMLGMNEIHYRRARDIISEYTGLVKEIQRSSPHTDIVLCAVSPVTYALRHKQPGHRQIPTFNKMLKKLAKKLNVRYCDYTSFLKDKSGYLKPSYAERDGYHWKLPVYSKFAKAINQYVKKIDQ